MLLQTLCCKISYNENFPIYSMCLSFWYPRRKWSVCTCTNSVHQALLWGLGTRLYALLPVQHNQYSMLYFVVGNLWLVCKADWSSPWKRFCIYTFVFCLLQVQCCSIGFGQDLHCIFIHCCFWQLWNKACSADTSTLSGNPTLKWKDRQFYVSMCLDKTKAPMFTPLN